MCGMKTHFRCRLKCKLKAYEKSPLEMLTCCIKRKKNASKRNSGDNEIKNVPSINGEKSVAQDIPTKEDFKNENNSLQRASRSSSVNSFYSVKSSGSEAGGDYYSVCSAESFKSA